MAIDAKSIAFGDLERELAVTRRVLLALPAPQLEWTPHPRSMNLGQLASHVADLPNWMNAALAADELEAANAPRPPAGPPQKDEILARFDRYAAELRRTIHGFDMSTWDRDWTMRSGSHVIASRPRPMVFRVWCASHLVHHRGQLCVYLRQLDVPVPTIYFNTADNPGMTFD